MYVQDPYASATPPAGGGAPSAGSMPMMQGQDQDAMKRQMLAQMLRGNGGNGYQQLGNSMGSLLGMLMAQKQGGGSPMPMATGAPMQISPQTAAAPATPGVGIY